MPNQAPSINATKSTYGITRVSTDAAGTQGNSDSSGSVFSPDGSKIAFYSTAFNLVAGDTNGSYDIFVKDLTNGTVTRVSVDGGGTQGNSDSYGPVFSPDASKIVFQSFASNLVAGDTNGKEDVFVKDLVSGAVTRVSVDAANTQGNDNSFSPVFSPDGSKIAFVSKATNLAAGGVSGAQDIFVKDLTTGAITRVTAAASGVDNVGSATPVFSPDGSKIAFDSDTPNLVAGDTNLSRDIFVKDLTSGTFTRVSVSAAGTQGNDNSFTPVFSPDGSKIAFLSAASNLVTGDTNGAADIFVKDLTTGTVTRVSVSGTGTQANSNSMAPVFSPDGSKIAFLSNASNLVTGDTNGAQDAFVKDLTTGAVTRVSVDAAGAQGNSTSYNPVFSPDGSRIVFFSDATNLVAGDTNNATDIFVKDFTLQHEDPAVYLQNAAAVAVNTQPVTITDADNTAFGGGSLTAALTAGSHAGDGLTLIVSATPGTGIEVSGASVSYNGTAIGTLSGNGTASLSVALNANADIAAVQALAGAVGFFSGSNPTADARSVTFTLVDGSGTAGGGHDTGSFTQTVLVVTENQAPQISFPNGSHVAADAGQTLAASSLFVGTDAEHDVLTYYVCDNTTAANSGHFMLDGSALQAGTVYTLTAEQYAQTTFVAGAKGVSDDILVMAYDGHHNSNNTNWSEVFVDAHINRPPQFTFPNGTHVAATGNQTLAISSLFVGSDLDHDVLTYYVYDKTTAANSGHFVYDGFTLQAGTVYTLTADQLALTTFVAGDSGVSDDLLVMAYDGQAYSNSQNWKEFFVDAAVNQAPQISFPHGANVAAGAGQTFAASSLFVGTDAENDVLTYYVCDNTTAANSGHFEVNGFALQAGTVYTLTAAQYAQTTFIAGDSGVSDDLLVMANDGHSNSNNTNWSELHVNAAVNQAPQISFPNGADVAAGAGQTFAASSLFVGNDAENDVLTYYVCDNTTAANSGHFVLDGSALQAGTVYTLTADQFAQTTFVAGASGVSDDLLVMAYDGHSNSNNTNWNELHVNAGPNQAPQINFPNGANVAASAGQSLAASSLWVGTDAEHDVLTYYVCDNTTAANSGHFVVDGSALQGGTVYTLTADQYAHTSFIAGASGASDDILVMAYDGHSNSNNTNWSEFHILV
jgi:Tol biopolymer transport system component